MLRQSNNVPTYTFGVGALSTLKNKIEKRRSSAESSNALFLVDSYFKSNFDTTKFAIHDSDYVIWIDTTEEPTTDTIDSYVAAARGRWGGNELPCAVIGIGGGCALDSAKAVSNLLTNGGAAEDYQGWDLVKVPGVFKIGVPTLSGTGAEASRTCVMTNKRKNIKLGMNSGFSVFDHLVLDPKLSETVDRNQYFYTAMDTYIHCVESLKGQYRHALADAYSVQAISLIREVCKSEDMMSLENREKVMVASYLGGASIANTYVGVVHPLSAGLSTVLHTHHCVANCIVMNVMDDFYAEEAEEFRSFMKQQKVNIPRGVCSSLDQQGFKNLYDSLIVHEKPLTNALGNSFREILNLEIATKLFRKM
jgi:3-deoxy-alpha-D-manno-octulosonate 8-oxidase